MDEIGDLADAGLELQRLHMPSADAVLLVDDGSQRAKQEAYRTCVEAGGGCGSGCSLPPSRRR